MKKLISIILIATMLISLTTPIHAGEPKQESQSKITISDALEILKSLADMKSIYDGSDVKPTIKDALEILKYLAGMTDRPALPFERKSDKSNKDKYWSKDKCKECSMIAKKCVCEPPVLPCECGCCEECGECGTCVECKQPCADCKSKDCPAADPLSEEMALRIETDFKIKTMHKGIPPRHYHGTYGDNVVMFLNGGGYDAPTGETVAEYYFYYPARGLYVRIWVWNNGEFYTLPEAYDLGLLAEDDIGQIHSCYKLIYPPGIM